MTFDQITECIIAKTIARTRIGWFDHDTFSHDMRVCRGRAYRIQQRLVGNRMTLRQAMWC